jgi:hypothetical protein
MESEHDSNEPDDYLQASSYGPRSNISVKSYWSNIGYSSVGQLSGVRSLNV